MEDGHATDFLGCEMIGPAKCLSTHGLDDTSVVTTLAGLLRVQPRSIIGAMHIVHGVDFYAQQRLHLMPSQEVKHISSDVLAMCHGSMEEAWVTNQVSQSLSKLLPIFEGKASLLEWEYEFDEGYQTTTHVLQYAQHQVYEEGLPKGCTKVWNGPLETVQWTWRQ